MDVFLDESGTHAGSALLLVGAAVIPSVSAIEHEIVTAHSAVLADAAFWPDTGRRDKFARRGFHHTDDSFAVREAFIGRLRRMDFRAHVAYSRRELGLADHELRINMLYTIVRNIALRYRTTGVRFIFEREPSMNHVFSKLVGTVAHDLELGGNPVGTLETLVAGKDSPALSLIDYVLAISAEALAPEAERF